MEIFMESVRVGDVASASLALHSDPVVAQHVRDVEAQIAAVGSASFVPSSERFRLQQRFLETPHEQRPWFFREGANELFTTTTTQTNVIGWLYGPAHSSSPDLTHTLGFLFYGVFFPAIQTNDIVVMELLLSSSTFVQVFSDATRQLILEDAMIRVGGVGAEATISLLVAHGASISGDDGNSLPVYGSRELSSSALLRHIAAEGAWFVGRQRVLHRMLVDAETLRELLRLGIDLRDDAVVDLRGTANAGALDQLEVVAVLLGDGVVDVDAQEDHGRFADSGTALMRAVRGLFGLRVDCVDETLPFVELLLAYADASVRDRRGNSAVEYLTMSASADLFVALRGKLFNA